jgi:osmotically-inducible protein OsmY
MHRDRCQPKGAAVANHNHNGGRDAGSPDDHRASWRPQDQSQATSHRPRAHDDDERSWRDRNHRDRDDERRAAERDPRRWEGGRGSEVGYHEDRDVGWRSTERYGQGQSGYSAGRHGEDRAQRMQTRNDLTPSSSGFEDRQHDLGVDDRFTGRGRATYWLDRGGHDADHHAARGGYEVPRGSARDADSERNLARSGVRPYDERMGYRGDSQSGHVGYAASHGQGYGRVYGPRPQGLQDDAHRAGATPAQRDAGPHRGRGPLGYQRSDERIHEAVCEALTDDDHVDATHIEVSVRNGEVTLSGVVEDRRAKRNAEDCVYQVSGVRDVQNLLRLRDDDRTARSNPFGDSAVGNGDIETLQNSRKPRA